MKSGALLAETKILLANWDASITVVENLDRFERDNILGKASRSRVKDILEIFRQRYLTDGQVIGGLAALIKNRCRILDKKEDRTGQDSRPVV